jgi:hypothetical protein
LCERSRYERCAPRHSLFIFVPGHEKSRARQPKFMLSCSLKRVWCCWCCVRARSLLQLGCLNEHQALMCISYRGVRLLYNSMEHVPINACCCVRLHTMSAHRNLFVVSFKKTCSHQVHVFMEKAGLKIASGSAESIFIRRQSPDLYSSMRRVCFSLSLALMQRSV